MNLFGQHNRLKQEQAKKALINVIGMNINKYIITQRVLNELLASGEPLQTKKSKKKECLTCQANKLLSKMGGYQDTVAESCKAFQLLFGKEIDLTPIISNAVDNHYAIASKKKKKGSPEMIEDDGHVIPDDAPEEVKNMFKALKGTLDGMGLNGVKMEVINTSADNFGLRQEDFSDFGEFAKAVSNARKMKKSMGSGKSAEEVLTESMIHKAEENHKDGEKLN